ncbi:MAG: ribosome maturation factor RimP [Ethanoligenens sp.]
MAAGKNVVSKVEKIALPIAETLSLSVWDIEYVKEGASWFLRIYIDKEGGVNIEDCEAFSRAIDGPLDDADIIAQQYYLEVSSPGIERDLKKETHFQAFIGKKIRVRFIRPLDDGRRECEGTLAAYTDGVLTLEAPEGEMQIQKAQTAFVKAVDDAEWITGGNESE